jgi:hypothetical protein
MKWNLGITYYSTKLHHLGKKFLGAYKFDK